MVHHERTYWQGQNQKIFTDIRLRLAKKTPESSQPFESYMKNISSGMGDKPLIMLLVNVLKSYVSR